MSWDKFPPVKRLKPTYLFRSHLLKQIKQGKPKRILTHRKLSVRAVEEEANLGNGSGYYYPDFVEKVKQTKAEIAEGNGEIVLP